MSGFEVQKRSSAYLFTIIQPLPIVKSLMVAWAIGSLSPDFLPIRLDEDAITARSPPYLARKAGSGWGRRHGCFALLDGDRAIGSIEFQLDGTLFFGGESQAA